MSVGIEHCLVIDWTQWWGRSLGTIRGFVAQLTQCFPLCSMGTLEDPW